MPRWAKVALGALGGVLAILLIGLLFLTQTNPGRQRVRDVLVSRLQSSAHGLVKVGPVRGNLLTGATIDGLVITDSTGAPFFRADTIQVRYSLLALLRQRIDVANVRLVNPVVVLDRRPGLAWNFSRIFPSDTTKPPTRQGFGAWVSIRDLDVVRGRVLVRNEWLPADSLAGAERERAIREALSPETRRWVVRVPGGFQSVQDYRQMNGRFARLRLTHPDSAAMIFDVARLSMVALPFRPPAAEVRNLAGRIVSSGDTLIAESLKVVFPGSRLTLNGAYDTGSGDTRARAIGAPLALQDLRWLYPTLPAGGGTLDIGVDKRGERTRLAARQMELRVETARLAGNFDVTFGDSLSFGPSDVRFAGVDTRLIQRLAPSVRPPRQGTLGGRVALSGTRSALQVNGNVSFVDRVAGTSRVFADGEIGTAGGFRARGLRLRLAPVQLALASAAGGGDIPVGGAITGEATLTGTARDGFNFRADLVHQASAVGRSRVTAAGAILRREESFAARDLRIRLDPLQVAVARAFKPDLPLTGTVTGTTTLNGTSNDLRLSADLVHRSGDTGRSHLVANGGVALGETFRARDLRLRFDPVQIALARAFNPDLPLRGAVTGTARLDGTQSDMRLVADLVHDSEPTGRSHVLANGALAFADGFQARGLRLRFDPLQVALARAFKPDLALGGTIAGATTLTGTTSAMRLSADLVHQSAATGRSHLVANGSVGFGDAFRATDLRLRMDPLQIALLRAFNPELPVGGFLAGRATVNGSTASRMAVEGDVTHQAPTGLSRLVGTASVPLAGRGRFAVDVRALPLSLATVGQFAPAAGLRGSATGGIEMTGTMRDLALSLGLAVRDGGTIDASGRLDLASARKAYDVRARFGDFNASAVTTRAPATALTGTASAVGRGTAPATMVATIAADLSGARVGTTGVDSVRLLTRLANGLAQVEQGTVRLASAQADVSGSFGLIATQNGTLNYRVRIDTLSQLAGFVPPDTARIQPRPAEVARAVQRARADSIRVARATEVERAATGRPAEPALRVDSVRPLPADSLAGSLNAEGVLPGNIKRFDARGTATMRDLIAAGNTVGSGLVTYQWLNAPTAASDLTLDAQLDSVKIRGFAMDSLGAKVRYAGGRAAGGGTLDLAVRQDPGRDYRAVAEFSVAPERREVRYSELALRFDTTFWRAPRPGAVRLANGGVELDDIELQATDGGRVFADGIIPKDGPANLRVAVDRLEIGDVIALLQDSVRVRGRLTLAADVRGTGASPVIAGTAGLVGGVVDTVRVPDADARFDYANRLLRGDARLTEGGRVLVTADGRLPINLALSGVTGPRFAADAPLELDVRADSLPLESVPSFTDAVSDVRGRVVGNLSVRGTRAAPVTRGIVNLDLGSLRIVQPGLALEDLAGTVRLMGDTAIVDSVSARSGDAPLRVTGGLDLTTPTQPGFDLRFTSEDARVLDNEMGRLRAFADVTMRGPYDAAVVEGNVRLSSGVIYAPEPEDLQRIEIDRASVTALADTAALRVVTGNPLLANMRVNVDVQISRDTWVRNSQANVEIFTPPDLPTLRVAMDRAAQTLTLEGTINAERGEYTFAGRRIRLSQGSVIFLGEAPINPILQLTAEQQVRLPNRPAFAIQLLVGGTMRAPRLTIASNAQPPIAESDLLSYFAFGESSSSLLQPESGGSIGGGTGGGGMPLGPLGGLAMQQLGATAVGAVVDQLEWQTTRALKLDVFNITPAPLPPELAVQGYLNVFRGAQFEAGRYLTSRWFLAAQGRTSAVLPGLLLEYRTPSGFSWVTSWEPRYIPQQPSLTVDQTPTTERVLGVFLQTQRRF
ncbi:MAG: translocation/assembly module TamB domain-containing protein, partial [Gemmatimonadetes bacterium]|nr:translocation/assembly module TamB domain-containing protein [Gemmatimonadota bacterium]